ncbi:uncharacterized protein BX664DRAFT_313825 [Halteromyces radiatus]|uniref:uncharacterized protein n=1 Tax=Halteromyces radiatus TaxID=101107 RepID=UPI00221F590F|nr:uncharacterized protein BX664DRAFT_313825 [Halteromyces radiatus]KAI8093813.1 hypothetical protein BX664DRAFT_313825 [Halteromyces radiatus]
MTKEHSQPKALNILRPSQPLSSAKSSVLSGYSSSSNNSTTRKPRVSSVAQLQHASLSEKPALNIYHPTSRSPNGSTVSSISSSSSRPSHHYNSFDYQQKRSSTTSYTNHPSNKERPAIEIYKPTRHHHPSLPKSSSMTKSFTAPVITSHSKTHRSALPNSPQEEKKYHVTNVTSSYLGHSESSQSATPSESEEEEEEDEDEDDQQQQQEEEEEEERKSDNDDQDIMVLNEARVNRQIADLEISNQSLLAVNAMLEATVRKQASEMAQMKKQMSFSEGGGVNIHPLVLPLPASDISEDEWENDKTFQRLCRMTDTMIEQAQQAVAFEFKGMGRVISYTEQDNDDDDNNDDDDDNNTNDSNDAIDE